MVKREETVETIDGTVYGSDDNWKTVWRREYLEDERGERHRVDHFIDGKEADRARFLAIAQSTSEGGRS